MFGCELQSGICQRITAKDDPRRVVIVEMHVIFEDRPAGDVVFKGLDQQTNLDKLKKSSVVFKESCHYKLKFVFRVQHDIVTGLRYHNGVYKAGIRGTLFILPPSPFIKLPSHNSCLTS